MTYVTMHKLGKKMWCPGPWKTLSLPVISSNDSTNIQSFFIKQNKQNKIEMPQLLQEKVSLEYGLFSSFIIHD